MEQITCLQPKELVTVSFLKNICTLFIDSTKSQRFKLIRLKKDGSFPSFPRSYSGQYFSGNKFSYLSPKTALKFESNYFLRTKITHLIKFSLINKGLQNRTFIGVTK